ncbi:phage portal, lambda family protein [Escherichia coli DEC4B]|nr:phage portal, lambda family protein [Escherichia coli DEC4B]
MKMSTIPTLLGPDGMTSLREYAGYHGGGSGFGGQLRAWNPPGESVDAALLPNFTRGNARADDLVRNNGYAANAIQLHQDHIVGSFFRLSHRPSWRYLGIGEEEARAFSREVEAAWKEFAEDDCCCIDVERKRTFTMMIREVWPCTPLTVNCSFRPPGIPVPRDCSGHSSGWSARSASATRTIPATAGTAVPVCRLMTAVRRWDITSARTGILAGCRRNGHGYPASYPAVVLRSFTSLNPWRTGRPAVQMCFTA